MATIVPPKGVEPPLPNDPADRARRFENTAPSRAPLRRRHTEAGMWVPIIVGALVVLGLIYWFTLRHPGFETASDEHITTVTVGAPDNKTNKTTAPATQPPATQNP